MSRCNKCGIQSSNEEIDRVAMSKAKKEELEHKRHFVDVSEIDKWGFDLISWDSRDRSRSTKVERLIEVKGHGHWRADAGLQDSELRAYSKNGDIYWIYYVDNCHTDNPILQAVHVRTWEKFGRITIRRRPRILVGGKRPLARKRRRRLGRTRIG